MGDALLFGGGGGAGGLREKPISREAFENLSEADRKNPYIIWIIKNANATDFRNTYGAELVTKGICWESYCKLSIEDRRNPGIVWVISDKTKEELAVLTINSNNGSKYYDVTGTPSSTVYKRIEGVDYALDRESANPIANMAVTEKIEEIKKSLGGLKFSVTETGGLRITYNDGK